MERSDRVHLPKAAIFSDVKPIIAFKACIAHSGCRKGWRDWPEPVLKGDRPLEYCQILLLILRRETRQKIMNYCLIFGNYFLCFRKCRKSEPVHGLFKRCPKRAGDSTKNPPMFWCLAKSLMSDNVPDWNECLKPGVAAPDYFDIHMCSDYFHQAPE